MIHRALPLIFALACVPCFFAQVATTDPFAAIEVYDGTWSITSTPDPGKAAKSDTLVNRCTLGSAFYSCEQIVNGKSAALVVFTLGDGPGNFHSQAVLPNGRAAGRTDIAIDGSHWTYTRNNADDVGKPPFYRTENFFSGRDKIHYEQYESPDNKTWVKKSEGDEVRMPSASQSR